MPYPYADAAGSMAGRPTCWSKVSQYDDRSSECRGCGWQASCRDTIIRANSQPMQPQPPMQPQYPNYPFQVPGLQAVPPGLPPMTMQQRLGTLPPVQPTRMVPQQAAYPMPVQQPPQQQQAITEDWYGRVNDPLFYGITTAAPQYRPQMPGESFFERLTKNVGLSMLEAAFAHTFLSIRQLILPPRPRDRVIDVEDTNPPQQ